MMRAENAAKIKTTVMKVVRVCEEPGLDELLLWALGVCVAWAAAMCVTWAAAVCVAWVAAVCVVRGRIMTLQDQIGAGWTDWTLYGKRIW